MSKPLVPMKVALVYDRVNKWGGAERVLQVMHEIFPDAPLYTSVYSPKQASWAKIFPEIKTTFLQKIPYFRNHHELIPWLMPIAFESLDFSNYDVVVSITSEYCKGIITKPSTLHVCYCLTPTRYLWSGYREYFDSFFNKTIAQPIVRYLRKWDVIAAKRPDVMIGISSEVQKRIKKYYGRDSKIVYPPVSFTTITNRQSPITDYYLLVSRLVKYKNIDLAIKTFNNLNKKLVVVGVGSEGKKLMRMSKNNIKFMGKVSDMKLSSLYQNANALIIPQLEDFGLVAVESQLHGTPVIAYGKGGALDTVINDKTGVLFNEQSEASLQHAIDKFEKMSFDKGIIKKNAKRFTKNKFKKEFLEVINKHL